MGGVCLTQACHAHDILSYVHGPVKTVFAKLATRVNDIEGEDCAAITVELANGSLAVLSATLGAAEETSRLRFVFGDMTVESASPEPYRPGKEPWHFKGKTAQIDAAIEAAFADFEPTLESFAGQFARIHACITQGAPTPVTLADARASLELITAIYYSAESGTPQTLPIAPDHPRYASWVPAARGFAKGAGVMTRLTLRGITKRYGTVEVIHGIDLDVPSGEFVVFVGPSGCGKSTLLRMIAGLEAITGGEFCIDGVRVNEVPPAQRQIAMVFQSYALYPHMTVYDNLAFGLQTAGEKKDVIDQRVQLAAAMLKIEPYLQRKPKALSGGQRQRVAIGRAIVRNPKLFLFDEPLSNLDAELRVQMRVELSKLHADLGTTMIYVTHDQVEAMTMADRIVVLRDGLIEQSGTPLELYNRPANRFVAGFIGSPKMNFLEAKVTGRDAQGLTRGAARRRDALGGRGCRQGVGGRRGHARHPPRACAAGRRRPAGHSGLIEQLGGNTVLYGTLSAQQPVVVQVVGQSAVRRGDTVHVQLPAADCHAFDAKGLSLAG